mmetsp:Transcript_7819/g.11351  ORF Transcript_7819/g.11351 Transcript_7819/m.11351 type:complete len:139 (+) Transcript_7819:158-574(+)
MTIRGKDTADEIRETLAEIRPVIDNWEAFYMKYEQKLNVKKQTNTKKKVSLDSAVATVDMESGDLVIRTYLVKVYKQAKAMSVNINIPRISDKESLMEEISELVQKEREISRKRLKLEQQLRRLKMQDVNTWENILWV